MEQLNLNFKHNEVHLKNLFERVVDRPVALTITDNSTSILSVKSKGETLYVRLHRIFLDAGADVIGEVAEFIRKRRGKTPLTSGFIREKRGELRKKAPQRLNICTSGQHYDLKEIFDSINSAYFEGAISSTITWGKKSPRYGVRKRTLGSFSSHTNTIRINPILDNKRIPAYFVEYVVYHEMLHAHIGIKNKNGRRSMHSREFREGEKAFKDYEKALIWEKTSRI